MKSYHKDLGLGSGHYKYNGQLAKWDLITQEHILSPEKFGAKGGSINDQAVFTSLSTDYIYGLGKEYSVPIWRGQATNFIGNNTKVHLDSVNGDTTVCLQIRENSHYSNISFINNSTQKKSWTYSVIGNNSVMNNVGFYNFDDNIEPKNSWGIYLENKKNITLNNCHFGKNGVSDIAVVDEVHNFTINDARNDEEGVSLDIEPNQNTKYENVVSGININGGHYRSVHVLENNYTAYGIKDVNISNASVDLLELKGGLVNVKGGEIKRIKGSWYPVNDFEGLQNEYLGGLRIENAQVSENLIKDPHLLDIKNGTGTSYWGCYAPGLYSVERKYDTDVGSYLDVNNSKQYLNHLFMNEFIDLPSGMTHLCVALNHAVSNGADANFNVVRVELKNSNGELVQTLSYKGCRVNSNQDSGWISEQGIFELPVDLGITQARVALVCKQSASYMIKSVGLYSFQLISSKGNYNQTLDLLNLPVKVTSTALTISLPDGTTSPKLINYDVPFTGVAPEDQVYVSLDQELSANTIISSYVTTKDMVRVAIVNFGAAIDKSVLVKIKTIN